MVEFSAKRYVLAGHIIERHRSIPGPERIARIFGEVRCSRCGGCAIDRWQQDEITARIVDRSAAERYSVAIFIKPDAVVDHSAYEILCWGAHLAAGAGNAAAVLATDIAGERECSLRD